MEISPKTLKDLAVKYRDITNHYMLNGPWNDVWDTGNLYNKIKSLNSATKMVVNFNQPYTISIDFAPDNSSYYGVFVHNGTKYVKARPFAEYAANSKEFSNELDKLGVSIMDQYFETFTTDIDDGLDSYYRSLT